MDDDDSYLCCTLGLTNPSQYCLTIQKNVEKKKIFFVGNFKWFCTKFVSKRGNSSRLKIFMNLIKKTMLSSLSKET